MLNFTLWNQPFELGNGDCVSKTSFFHLLGKSESFLISIGLIENSRITHTGLKHLSRKKKKKITFQVVVLPPTFLKLEAFAIALLLTCLSSGQAAFTLPFSKANYPCCWDQPPCPRLPGATAASQAQALPANSRPPSAPGPRRSLSPRGSDPGEPGQILSLWFSPITTQFIFHSLDHSHVYKRPASLSSFPGPPSSISLGVSCLHHSHSFHLHGPYLSLKL